MKARLLVVDDDPAVLSSLRRALTLEDYDVLSAPDGDTALRLAQDQALDLVVLDVMLPGIDGLSVCRRLRERARTPILMLTARDTVLDRVAGLDSGADDYLVKPFVVDELLARIRALLRRTHTAPRAVLECADLRVDLPTREVRRGGMLVPLTPREFDLLEVFLRHSRQVLSREQLCQQVWGYGFAGESNFVDVAVKELRKKLEMDSFPRLIQTVRGFGYALREE